MNSPNSVFSVNYDTPTSYSYSTPPTCDSPDRKPTQNPVPMFDPAFQWNGHMFVQAYPVEVPLDDIDCSAIDMEW